ncbi:HK97 family phage prohead protease [Shigella dysenteriae]|uniref:HK97 family phage prohead protease n=1 Tax=Shigella dysenteriae TaxID=622 RepID=UPI000E5C9979|nr:HK97 family phage prohead protease [Shigella dysenteriae]RIE78328.1 HK97 family phage prohead protease [Shigella dysenteriae]
MGEKIMKSMEIRSSEITTSGAGTLTGYIVCWDKLSELLWGEFYEKFQRRAFTEWLAAGNDVRGLYEHDHSMLLGRTRSGTLKLEEDETGLRFELTPPDTSTGRDVIELVKRGDISGMSFGFRSRKDVWDTTTDPCVRTVLVAELYEITVTSVPAYPDSGVELARRSLYEQHPEKMPRADNRRWWADLAGV